MMGLLMFLGSFLSHEKFISLLSVLFHHPLGTARSLPFPGSLFGSVRTAIPSPVNLSPGKPLPFIFITLPNHIILYRDGSVILLYHPFSKSQWSPIAHPRFPYLRLGLGKPHSSLHKARLRRNLQPALNSLDIPACHWNLSASPKRGIGR
jgi:hypothetical protein